MTCASELVRNGQTPADAFDPCAESPVTHRFVKELVGSSSFKPWIHTADDMYRYNLSSLKGSRPCAAILYYSIGWQILQTVQHVAQWRFGGLDRVSSVLDFASGHGRVTRFLLQDLSPEKILISEIHADAVAFQRGYFGVKTVLSTSDPSAFLTDRRVPLVIASSFFSHVPGHLFRAWMDTLLRWVDRDGALLFSTLGSQLLGAEAKDFSEGIHFLPESETNRLEKSSYGTAYVTEDFVRDAIGRNSNARWSVTRFPEGFCGFQDLYIVAEAGAPSVSGLKPIDFARGDADLYEIEVGGRLRIEGWLRIRVDGPAIQKVEFRVNQNLLRVCEPRPVGPGAFRWFFEVDSRQIAPDDVLMIQAISSEGLASMVALGTLQSHPPARGS